MKSATLLSLALLTVSANANIFPTEPVAATVWNGGDKVKLLWKDDNKAPSLAELNDLTIELMTGTDTNQTSLSVIGKGIKGTAGTADYTVPKDIGPPGQFYFVRFNQAKTFVWSTRFNIQNIAPPAPNAAAPSATTSSAAAPYPAAPSSTTPSATATIATVPLATTSKAPDAPKASNAPKADAPSSSKAPASSPAAATAAVTTTPTPASASEAIGISPSSLMSIAIGGVAFIFTYMY